VNDSLLKWRSEFPIVGKSVYLVNHSLGAMPQRTMERLKEYGTIWAQRGVRAWSEGWWEIPKTTGDLLGKIFNAPPDSVVMHQNVSVATGVLLSCFDWGSDKRNKIVTNDLEFPSILYVCREQTRVGARVEVVSSRNELPDIEAIVNAMDDTTKIVVISLVFFRNAALADLSPIISRAREVGAYVMVDAYQGLGTVPLDVQKADIDFLTGGSVKWLCGGPGAAYLYVKPSLIPLLEPKVTGWAAHQDPFAFDTGRIEYSRSINRFLHGTPAVPALYAARSGYEIIVEIGVNAIREKSLRQTGRIIELSETRGFPVRTPKEDGKRGGSVTVDIPHGAALVRALEEKEVLCDFRPGSGVRLSPHFYTEDGEIDRAFEEIDRVLESKSYAPFEGMPAAH